VADPPLTRSHWHWGWEERLPDLAARHTLADQVGALLGVDDLSPRPLPSLSEARAPEARIAAPSELTDFVTTDREARIRHTYGRSYRDVVRGFLGDFSPAPDLVATPRDESEVSLALAWCSASKVACVPYGGGTSVVGGVEHARDDRYRATLSLDLSRLDALVDVDVTSRLACFEAGATGPRVEAHLAPHGLTLRHFPQSFEHSTLGGWIATRAGGHFATLYTHIDDLTHAVRMVCPSGVYETSRVPASGAGPDPARILLGSEGALGVITRAWMRVQARPRWRLSASARFDRFEDAVEAARAVAQSGLHPANCRLLDASEALLNGVFTASEGAVLLLGFESADHAPDAAMARAIALCGAHNGACPEGVTRRESSSGSRELASQRWRDAFLGAPYLQSALVTVGVMADTFETACTWSNFGALHRDVTTSVSAALAANCGGGRVTCRFTHVYPDGPAVYYTFLGRARAGDELTQWAAVKAAASDALARNGATITHHHAVGRTHRPWYDRERPALFAASLSAVKRTLDPASVMNPGVLIDVSGS
jgi:alkyldihydroxyacetonephosphate synthase